MCTGHHEINEKEIERFSFSQRQCHHNKLQKDFLPGRYHGFQILTCERLSNNLMKWTLEQSHSAQSCKENTTYKMVTCYGDALQCHHHLITPAEMSVLRNSEDRRE